MSIKDNIFNLIQNLPAQCKLVVVSKTQTVERVKEAYDAGHRIFGENKAQELTQKYEALPKDIEWHMIDPILRWNTCARIIMQYNLKQRQLDDTQFTLE